MGVLVDDREFDPALRSRIAAFIERHFEEPDDMRSFAGSHAPLKPQAYMPPPTPAAASRPKESSKRAGFARGLMAELLDGASRKLGFSRGDEDEYEAGYAADLGDYGVGSGGYHADLGEPPFADALSRLRDYEAPSMASSEERCEVPSGMPHEAPSSMPHEAVRDMFREASPEAPRMAFREASRMAPREATSDLASWLDHVDEPFSTTLLALIDRKGLTDVDVYKRAHMSRQLFSRIRSDASYRPAKKTVLALAIAMGLSLDETRDLLERAGFALSRSSKRDLIVEFFVTNGIYDLFALNEALYEFDEPLI